MSEMVEQFERTGGHGPMSDSMVEKVAIAQAGARWAEFDEEHKEAARDLARTAIAAMREPTEAMIVAGDEIDDGNGLGFLVWQTMIDEALR